MKQWFQLCWWAANTDGICVSNFRSELGEEFCIGFGNAATSYNVVHRLQRALQSRHTRLNDSVHAGLTLAGPIGRRMTMVALLVSDNYQEARLCPVPDSQPETLGRFIEAYVTPGNHIVTNGGNAFSLPEIRGYHHHPNPQQNREENPAFANDCVVKAVEERLQAWLAKVGWQVINRKNLSSYLAEFSFRYSVDRRGYGPGAKFSKLLELVLKHNR
ncbi:MAG: transposase [Verrucomicrobiota bacterium]